MKGENSYELLNSTTIALLYIVFASVWIFGSDQLVQALNISSHQQTTFQTIKGLLFVMVTGGGLYALMKKRESYLNQRREDIQALTIELHHRIKNTLALINGLLELEKDQYQDETKIKNVLERTATKIKSISVVHDITYHQKFASRIDLFNLLSRLKKQVLVKKLPDRLITIEISEAINLSLRKAVPLALLVNEFTNYILQYIGETMNQLTIRSTHQNSSLQLSYIINPSDKARQIDTDDNAIEMQLTNVLADQLQAEVSTRNYGSNSEIHFQIPLSD